MVAVGTAHDALLTWFTASPPGSATRSTSSALDGRGSFPEPGWGEHRPKGSGASSVCARNVDLSTPALVEQKIDKYGCAGPRPFCGGPEGAMRRR